MDDQPVILMYDPRPDQFDDMKPPEPGVYDVILMLESGATTGLLHVSAPDADGGVHMTFQPTEENPCPPAPTTP